MTKLPEAPEQEVIQEDVSVEEDVSTDAEIVEDSETSTDLVQVPLIDDKWIERKTSELSQRLKFKTEALRIAAANCLKDPELWTKYGEGEKATYRPTHAGFTRCASILGITYKTTKIDSDIEKDYISYTYETKMSFTAFLGEGLDVEPQATGEGEWNSEKPMFKYEKNMRGIRGNISKMARSQAEVNAFMVLMGLKGMSGNSLKRLDIDASKINGIKFKKKGY